MFSAKNRSEEVLMRFITLVLRILLRFQHNHVQSLWVIVSSLQQNVSLNPRSTREKAVFFRKDGVRLTAQSSANEIAAVPHPSLADRVKVSCPLLMLKTPVCPGSSFSITNLNICHWLNQYQQVTPTPFGYKDICNDPGPGHSFLFLLKTPCTTLKISLKGDLCNRLNADHKIYCWDTSKKDHAENMNVICSLFYEISLSSHILNQ